MDSIVAWVAFLVLVTAAGPDTQISSPLNSEQECIELNIEAAKAVAAVPEIIALGVGCQQVTVTLTESGRAVVEGKAPESKKPAAPKTHPANPAQGGGDTVNGKTYL